MLKATTARSICVQLYFILVKNNGAKIVTYFKYAKLRISVFFVSLHDYVF